MTKLLQPFEAVSRAAQEIEKKHKFLRVSRGNDSLYFVRLGNTIKIRVSNHKDPKRNDDCIIDLVFDYNTLQGDVEVRCQRAVEKYFNIIRNRRYRVR